MWAGSAGVMASGLGMGLWKGPNTSIIMGSISRESFGIVGALTNVTRNVGNVAGQAIASAVVVGIMAADGFDIPLGEIAGNRAASDSFMNGWKLAYILVTAFSLLGLLLSILTKPRHSDEGGRD